MPNDEMVEKARRYWQDADTKPTPILMAEFTNHVTADLRTRNAELESKLAAAKEENEQMKARLQLSSYEAGYIAGHAEASSLADRLRDVLIECRAEWDYADNGVCAVCRTGHRLYDLKGNAGKCENGECLSHRIRAALDKLND